MTLISIANQKARPVNPHPYIIRVGGENLSITKVNPDWIDFEQSVTEHEAPGFEEGEAEGELIELSLVGDKWIPSDDAPFSLSHNWETKEIWRIVTTPEKVEAQPADIDVGQWISVKDRLPESDTEVNVLLADNRVRIATFIINNGFKSFYCAGGVNISYGNVISWHPLPKAPTH
jgi:hypothetical protein